jgi:glycosyltransferase involved in cell wall biosynthesis
MVEQYKKKLNLQYVWHPNWGGPARPRNIGANMARGEWLCFLDADDFWYDAKLERIDKFTCGNDVIYHSLNCVCEDNLEKVISIIKAKKLKKGFEFIDLLRNGNKLANSGVAVRRSCFEKVGGVSEDRELVAVEDFDLWIRLARCGFTFKAISDSLGIYVMGAQDQISKPSDRFLRSTIKVYQIYQSELTELNHRYSNGCLHYVLGMLHYRSCGRVQAIRHFWNSTKLATPRLKFKALLRMCQLFFLNPKIPANK